jgi:hypothetical protein
MSEKPLGPTTNKQPSGNQKSEQAVSIQTKVSSFTEVQRSLEEIKNVLDTLSAKQIPDGVTDESETEGTPGSIRVVKNDLDQSLFEIKTEDGWKKPMVGKTAVTFETIENNQKPIRAESIDEIEANDTTTGDNKANNTIYDEKANKFVIARPDFDSGWLRWVWTDVLANNDPPLIVTHDLGTLPTLVKVYFAPDQGSGSLGDAVDVSAITWFTDADTDTGSSYNHGTPTYVSRTEVRMHAGQARSLVSSNFVNDVSDHRTVYRDGSMKILLWK